MAKKKNQRGPPKTSPKAIKVAEKHAAALELRKAGVSLAMIAQTLGYSEASGAHKAIKRAITKIVKEPAEELLALELERLDAIQIEVYRSAKQGHLGAIDRLLRIMERRSKLLGLDLAKERLEHSGALDVTFKVEYGDPDHASKRPTKKPPPLAAPDPE